MYRKILFACIWVILSLKAFGQGYHYSPDIEWMDTSSSFIANSGGAYNYGDTINVTIDEYYYNLKGNPYPSNLKFKSVRDYVKIAINDTSRLVVPAYKYTIELQVLKYIPMQGTTDSFVNGGTPISLDIEYDPDSLHPYKDQVVYEFDTVHKFALVITGIHRDSSGIPVLVPRSQLAQNFVISTAIGVQRYDYSSTTPVYIYPASSVNNNNLDISWGTSVSTQSGTCPTVTTNEIQPVEFELEWAYIDDYQVDVAGGTSSNAFASASSINYDFRKNATRIRLQKNSFSIPLIYERGAIVFRLRAIRMGDYSENYQGIHYGAWNIPDSGSVNTSESCKVYVLSSAHMSDQLNWQYTINFAEEGKYKHVINYFDGTLKNRQTQTKINTDNNYIIAVDKFYDYEGNTAISTLPVPVQQTNLSYLSNVTLNSATGNQYVASDFDASSCNLPDSFAGVSNSSKAKIYYSSLNPDTSGLQKLVPDAKSYPLIQSVYSPDKLLLWQGGAGLDHQLWTPHSTRYDYAHSNQDELNTLFGNEAGNESFYPKVVVTDPDQQTSFKILNTQGQSVATGLIGVPDTIGSPIDRIVTADTGAPFCFNVLGESPQDRSGSALSINTKYYVEKGGPHTLQYRAKINAYPTGCSGDYIWAEGKYKYSVVNECGALVITDSGTLGHDYYDSVAGEYFSGTPIGQTLSKENYTIYKKLTFDKYSIHSRVEDFVTNKEPNCYHDERWYVKQSVDSTDFPCINTGSVGPCELKRQQLIKELWPGAKYGQYEKNADGSFRYDVDICGIAAITYTNSLTLFYHIPITKYPNYTNQNSIFSAVYYDSSACPNGSYGTFYYYLNVVARYQDTCLQLPDTVIKNGRIYTNIASLPVDTFIYIFNDDIAEALLPLHPEYCKMKFCDDGEFIKDFESFQTFKQAELGNRFSLDSIIKYDPIYYKADPQDQPLIQGLLANFKNLPDKRLDTFAIEQAYCSAGNPYEHAHCVKYLYDNQIDSFTFIDDTVKQSYYEHLQQMYFMNRSMILQQMMDSSSNTCESCADVRMTLIDPPVFVPVFTQNGGFDSSLHIASWIDSLFININDTGFDLSTLHTPSQLQDSLSLVNHIIDTGRVEAIMASLKNCSVLQSELDLIKSKLYYLIDSDGKSIDDPVTVQGAIVLSGVSLTDLCNGYLPTVKSFNTTNDIEYTYDCKQSAYYDGLKSFFDRGEVLDAIKVTTQSGGTTYGFHLDPDNKFENELADLTSISEDDSVMVRGYLDTLQASGDTISYLKLLVQAYNTLQYTYLYLYNKVPGDSIIYGDSSLTLSVEKAYCINEDNGNSLSDGKLGKNTAVIEFLRTDTLYNDSHVEFYVWSKDVEFMESSGDKLPIRCITCIDIKNALKDIGTYLGVGNDHFNHPYTRKHLANFLNYKLNAKYTYTDYYDLMKTCALSDSQEFKRYFASIEVTCSTKGLADIFAYNLAAYTPRDLIDFRYEYSTGSTIFGINLGLAPEDSILQYKNEIATIVHNSSCASTYLPEEPLKVFVRSGCSPSPALSTYDTFTTDWVKVYSNDTTTIDTLYTYAGGSYASPYAHAQLLANVNAAISQCNESFVVADAELLRGEDYGSTYSDAYLSYIYSLDTLTRYEIRDSISIGNLGVVIDSFAGKTLQYQDPYCTNSIRDLYIYDDTQSSYPGSSLLTTILNNVKSQLGSNKLFLPEGSLSTGSSGAWIFRKASGVHWYRYFDNNNNLYNVHLQPPANAPFDINTLILDSVKIGPGADSIYRFTTYMHYSVDPTDVITCKGYTDFPLGYGKRLANIVLYDKTGLDFCLDSFDCEYAILQDAIQSGRLRYRYAHDSTVNVIANKVLNYMLDNTKDTLYFCSASQKNQITLYYYDLNGNLRKTVPPAGVVKNPSSGNPHTKVTEYKYDSRNLLVYQKTPDGGETEFYYDGAGRLVFSRNDKQKELSYRFSYTLYDELGRPTETGEVEPSSASIPPGQPLPVYVTESYNDDLYPMDTLIKYVRSQTRFDVVRTIYDTVRVSLDTCDDHLSAQTNLVNRVSSISWYKSKAPDYIFDYRKDAHFTTYFSYDMVGNVKTITYDCLEMQAAKQRYKRVDYDYDLISGKVNMISYNRGKPDQFYQRYEYDADNRIVKAESSNDGIIWNRDASYEYYKHGPLAQVRIGDHQIQSIEYAYTIQGWLKAINGDVLRPDKSVNPDTLTYARDVIAHALNYFDGDYVPIDTNMTLTNFSAPPLGMYNGNITRTNTAILGLGNQRGTYRYDQLNRLTKASYETVNESNLTVNTPSDIYKNTYKYDEDGNITELVRYDGNAANIDSMLYHYTAGTNRLSWVDDQQSNTGGDDFQPGQGESNYLYDELGNLIEDTMAGLKMDWTLYGKLKTVEHTKSPSSGKYYYYYDGLGNRFIKKNVKDLPGTEDFHEGEYYVRDASGNILAVYKFHYVFDRLKMFGVANAGLQSNSSFPSFVNGICAPIGSYITVFTTNAINTMPGWVDAQTDRAISFYLVNDGGLYSEILTGEFAPDYLNDLQVYSSNNLGLEIFAGPMNANLTAAQVLMEQARDYETEAKAMFTHFDTEMPSADLDNMWTNLNVGVSRDVDHTANGDTLYNFMVNNHQETDVIQAMVGLLQNNKDNSNGTEAKKFYAAMIDDDVIFESTNLRSSSPPLTDFEQQLQSMLYGDGDMSAINGFFDQWSESATWLGDNTTQSHRMGVVYVADADNVLGDYLNTVSDVKVLDTLLASVDEINAFDYLDARIAGPYSSSFSAVVIGTGWWSTTTVVDTTDLAEHHIYGSSRLGVQQYPAGQLRETYNIDTNVTQLTGLSDSAVWYSHDHSDLITAGDTEPYGNHHYGAMQVNRTLGYRNYEMTDHLGNVLATLLDRRTGYDTGGSYYNYWQPDMSSVQDYYPGGMRMEQRHNEVSDSIYRFGWQGNFEKDDEIMGSGNYIDWGGYGYDPRLERRWTLDKLHAKYPWQSPYSAVGNNPILNHELDGKDYAVYPDHNTRTIIIKATYYTIKGNTDDNNSAVKATQFWNNQSGKYQYKVGKGKGAVYYDIDFQLNVKEVDNPNLQVNQDKYPIKGYTSLVTDGSSNTYEVLPDKNDIFKNNDPNEETNAVTNGGALINVKDSQKETMTGAHEVGHTLGFGHIINSIMSRASNIGRSETTKTKIIGQILKHAGLGRRNYSRDYQGTGAGNLQPSTGEAPVNFSNGKVIKKEN